MSRLIAVDAWMKGPRLRRISNLPGGYNGDREVALDRACHRSPYRHQREEVCDEGVLPRRRLVGSARAFAREDLSDLCYAGLSTVAYALGRAGYRSAKEAFDDPPETILALPGIGPARHLAFRKWYRDRLGLDDFAAMASEPDLAHTAQRLKGLGYPNASRAYLVADEDLVELAGLSEAEVCAFRSWYHRFFGSSDSAGVRRRVHGGA